MTWKTPPSFMKKGAKVLIRPDNSKQLWQESHDKGEYPNPNYVDKMDKWRGKMVILANTPHRTNGYAYIDEDGQNYAWSWASFLPPSKEELNAMVLNGELDVDT